MAKPSEHLQANVVYTYYNLLSEQHHALTLYLTPYSQAYRKTLYYKDRGTFRQRYVVYFSTCGDTELQTAMNPRFSVPFQIRFVGEWMPGWNT